MTDSNPDRTDVHFPKIFKAYEFQFLGLSPEIEKKYCKIVTDLGGKVSNQSGYALTTRDHVLKLIKSTKNNNNLLNVTRMYKILYLLHSIEARKPLPIDLYRFESVKKQAEEKTNKRSFQQLLQEDQQEKFTQKPHKRLKIDSSSSSEEEELLQEEQQEKFTKKSHKRLKIESSSSSEEDIIPSSNNSPIKSRIELTCNGNTNDHSINVESISESLESEARLRHNTITNTINESSDDCIENNSSDDDDSLIENRSKWWISQDIPEKARCKQVLCTFSPEIHRSHGRPQHTMTMFEQRIMIAFIIKFNVIDKIKGAKIYKDMGKFGYLTHRTHETLRNNMRRSIMPKINTFGLPENILKQFEDFR